MSSVPHLRAAVSRSGLPNVEIDGIPYHSVYDPRREARKFYSSYPIEKADVILHFGWGLGYAANALLERLKPSDRVIVFEPDEDLFKLALTHMDNPAILQDSRFEFVVGPRVCHFFDEWMLDGCQETDEFLWLIWPAAHQIYGAIEASLLESFKVRLRDRAANLLTHFQNGRTYFENVLRNCDYQNDPDAGTLFGRFRNIPLVIVSAGPSLDRNVRELRGKEGHCFILAVDTALRPLLAAGIVPHAVIIADPQELNAKHIVGAMPETAYLIAEQAIHLSALQCASRRFLFGLGLFPDPLFAKFGFAKSSLEVWGSVATAALDLALKMGANPIIFAGQDFAYSWGRDYARHTIFDGAGFDIHQRATHYETDIWNHQVGTTENLIAYRDFFVRKMRQISGLRFINATEGGILRDAVEILSLRDALHQTCNRPVDVSRILLAAHHPLPPGQGRVRASIEHLSSVLNSRASDCGCLAGFLELTAKEAVLKGNQDSVNESILWGWRVCEEFHRAHAESGVAPPR
jgi:hypothetical protein